MIEYILRGFSIWDYIILQIFSNGCFYIGEVIFYNCLVYEVRYFSCFSQVLWVCRQFYIDLLFYVKRLKKLGLMSQKIEVVIEVVDQMSEWDR